MAEAAAGRPCGMIAVLGLDREQLQEACRRGRRRGGGGDRQLQLPRPAGHRRRAGRRGPGRRTGQGAGRQALPAPEGQRPLPHLPDGPRRGCPAGAVPETWPSRDAQIPVLFNCLGGRWRPEDTIPELLEQQVQTSVYMEDTIRRLAEHGGGHHRGDRPGQGPQRLCEEDRSRHQTYAVETCGGFGRLSDRAERSNAMNFTGRTAVVTGGSRGIGRAICLELARGGANVALLLRGQRSGGQGDRRRLRGPGGQGRGRPVRRGRRGRR